MRNPARTDAKVAMPACNHSVPNSFIDLHHWCKPWSSIETFEPNAWEPDANGLGRVFVNGYFSPRTPEFLRLAIESLHQLGDDIESTKLGELADDASLKSLVRAVERRCESGAVSKGELPQGWFERPSEGLSVPLPPFPLRSSDDVCRWLKAILDDSGRRKATPATRSQSESVDDLQAGAILDRPGTVGHPVAACARQV